MMSWVRRCLLANRYKVIIHNSFKLSSCVTGQHRRTVLSAGSLFCHLCTEPSTAVPVKSLPLWAATAGLSLQLYRQIIRTTEFLSRGKATDWWEDTQLHCRPQPSQYHSPTHPPKRAQVLLSQDSGEGDDGPSGERMIGAETPSPSNSVKNKWSDR